MQAPGTAAADRTRAYVLAFASAAAAGAGAVVGKVGVSGASTTTFVLWICAFATLFSTVWTFRRAPRVRTLTGRGARLMLLHAALAGVGLWGWYSGLPSLHPAVASFVSRTEVLVTIALGALWLGERLGRLEVVGGVVALAGLALMSLPPDPSAAAAHGGGIVRVLVGSLGWGASEIMAKQSVGHVDPRTFVLARSALLAFGWAVVAAATGEAVVPPLPVLASAAGVALLGPVIARALYMHALRVLEISRAALVAQVQPLFAALVAFVALADVPRPIEWAGGLVLLGGTLLVVWGARLAVRPARPES